LNSYDKHSYNHGPGFNSGGIAPKLLEKPANNQTRLDEDHLANALLSFTHMK